MNRSGVRWAVLGVVVVLVFVWALTWGQGEEEWARSFLRNLFRVF